MKQLMCIFLLLIESFPVLAVSDRMIEKEIRELKRQSQLIQLRLSSLENKINAKYQVALKHRIQKNTTIHDHSQKIKLKPSKGNKKNYITSALSVHFPRQNASASHFHPSVLMADDHVVTYIAGTPIITFPYVGSRPAFDGSDYIVNISSINPDIRLMQQRQRFYHAYQDIGDPIPDLPIIALSGKLEPVANYTKPFGIQGSGDINLGSTELAVAALLNANVEGYIGIGYDDGPSEWGGPRVSNSAFSLNSGFVNIGNLDLTPLYFTAGQMNIPFGRYSTSMVSTPLTSILGKTKTRPVILGYKSQQNSGPYAAVFAFRSTTDIGGEIDEGVNVGYTIDLHNVNTDLGVSWINALDESLGMQNNGALPGYFGGFGSIINGSESVAKVSGVDFNTIISIDRYNFTVEWLAALNSFRTQDLSFNGYGAKPSAGQIEASVTFMAFNKPATVGAGYQWTREALALNLPRQRFSTVFNISIWKNTVESLEYRHDVDYAYHQFANGASPPGVTNLDINGTGSSSDSVVAQIGVYF